MREASVELYRCPACGNDGLDMDARSRYGTDVITGLLSCPKCGAVYRIENGIADFLSDEPDQTPTLAQRYMENPLVAKIYERYWRPTLVKIFISPFLNFNEEAGEVLRLLGPKPGDTILDLAPGTGNYTRRLARAAYAPGREPGGQVVGCDLSRPMLSRAAETVREKIILNAGFVRGDALRLPFSDAVFEKANCCGAIHLFPDPAKAVEEIFRVLKPGGAFSCLTFVNSRSAHIAAYQRWSAKRTGMRVFEEEELAGMCKDKGLGDFDSWRRRNMFVFRVIKR